MGSTEAPGDSMVELRASLVAEDEVPFVDLSMPSASDEEA